MRSLTPLLNVIDASRSIQFYKDILGFTVSCNFEYEGKVIWAQLSWGPINLMINGSQERSHRLPRTAESYDDAVFYFEVEDAPRLHAELLRKGCAPGLVERQDYGADEFTMRDPDGYELAFASRVTQP